MGGSSDSGAEDAAEVQAQAQREALNYLKQTERLPQALREGALTGLGSEYGLTLGADGKFASDGKSIIQRAEDSPFYQTMVQRGEEGVLRNASATGGLRSGNTNEALASVNQNALMASYANQLSGLQGMAQLPSNANNIASSMAGIGQTTAQGMTAQANFGAQQGQNNFNNAMGAGALAMQGYETFSDERLKDEVVLLGQRNGHNVYRWAWNAAAAALGLVGRSAGVIAQEVEKTHPHAVSERRGYKCVNYDMIGVEAHGL
ncbi:hypothetical protein HU742_018090 [Pseudomonas sp. SWRI102]|uniref:Peptidase S74 domain-containing protein n=1 Tax=Pseudomonas marvdashtae TaxID=2745500 RepID=A0A923FLM4_9PSED|nr:hypothetical protein [Pseudomonas marvdashtae]MBV4553059.1 hypothetical protein [Pseudomonas marvdashtae]